MTDATPLQRLRFVKDNERRRAERARQPLARMLRDKAGFDTRTEQVVARHGGCSIVRVAYVGRVRTALHAMFGEAADDLRTEEVERYALRQPGVLCDDFIVPTSLVGTAEGAYYILSHPECRLEQSYA